MVGIILCFSVVARMKMTYDGGSSRVFRKALNAAAVSMCTSSMMNTRYFPDAGGIITWSMSWRMSSTPLFDAASSSRILSERFSLNCRHESHWLQASPSGVREVQLIVLAKIRAQDVLPTPRDPQKRYACARRSVTMAFLSVAVRAGWPTTDAKVDGRYFLADTIYCSMSNKCTAAVLFRSCAKVAKSCRRTNLINNF